VSNPVRRIAGRLRHRGRQTALSAYYAIGYDRQLPGQDRIEAQVRRWEAGRGDVPKEPEAWDAQYSRGGWAFLSDLSELAHYAVIVGYADHLRPRGSVLDVGCGAGTLHERFRSVGYSHYTGVDISEVAVADLRARVSLDPTAAGTTDFVAADADEFTPRRTYDLVIFNESLTYFPDPAATFRRYLGFLRPGGVAIVSCHVQSPRAQAILRGLLAEHHVLDEALVEHGRTSWRIAVFPRPA
jgi:SAM-dependent methyltransferase